MIISLWNKVKGLFQRAVKVPLGLLSGNTTYFWRVRYRDDRGSWSDWSEPQSYTTEGAAPPINLFTAGGRNTIRIVWDRNSEEGILGYNIYRSPTSGNFEAKVKINSELLLDPVYLDGEESPLPTDSVWYYQVEVVMDAEGRILTSVSGEVSGQEGRYRMFLPELRAAPGSTILYPLSTLNARGISDNGFVFILNLPDHIVDLDEIDFEKTALTEDYDNIQLQVLDSFVPPKVSISSMVGSPTKAIELNGDGAFINLRLKIREAGEVILGETGETRIEQAELQNSQGTIVVPDFGDPGRILVANEYKLGDLNGDGFTLFSDIRILSELVVGMPISDVTTVTPLDPKEAVKVIKAAADLNADGVIDVADLALIRNRLGQKTADDSRAVPAGPSKGPLDSLFEIRMNDAVFPSLPGVVEAVVSMDRPEADLVGVSAVAFTITYPTEELEFDSMGTSAKGTFENLVYDHRDYLRGFRPGTLRVVMSSSTNQTVNGEIARVRFRDVQPVASESADVDFRQAKMARSSGEDISWNNDLALSAGRMFFTTPETPTPTETPEETATFTPTHTPTFSETPTATETPTGTMTMTPVSTDTPTPTPTEVAFPIDAHRLLELLRMIRDAEKDAFDLLDFASHWLESAPDGR